MDRYFDQIASGSAAAVEFHPLDDLPLDTLEEAAGEIFRRITVAMRDIGELRADEADSERRSPRRRIASLAVLTELAIQVLHAAAAGVVATTGRIDSHPAAVAAVMYGAPTLGGLLQRLEQDRRMLASAARNLEARLDEPATGPWPGLTLRGVLTEAAIVEPAACAQSLELQLARWDEAERAMFEAERQADL